MTLQRRSWARGENVPYTGYVEVAGPDRTAVHLSVVRLDVPGAVPKPKPARPTAEPKRRRRPGPDASALASDASGLGAVLAMAVGLGFLLLVTGRWLFIELTGRPHYAVLATADGVPAVQRTRRRKQALIAAATLADRIERDGTAALTTPGSSR
uniref:hypothetical protein n=1 Tax=Kitasatospora purpeofusca TaxID=67352 RepID=UPI0036D3B2E3